ncbi:MAG: hypothetical protein LBT00_01180 [Spirochaetaceae bacterium]|nr:hypothetical protein [Spirochaetaceae bacterium]
MSLRTRGNLPLVKQSSAAAIVIARSEATKQSSRGAFSPRRGADARSPHDTPKALHDRWRHVLDCYCSLAKAA